ncbi:hypothetical protein CLAIMM_04370 [Cladophialophora immunda]|nr:hypothetical protein CLAIMM_04370 [Cladophialophora immunda]
MRTFCASPLYHSHGLMSLFRAIYSRKPIYFGNWSLAPTARNLSEAIRAARPQLVAAVPYILKLLSETEDGLAELEKAEMVLYAGSNCPQELGDMLVSRGINLAGNYGSTEIGYIMNSFHRDGIDDRADWNYYRLQDSTIEHVFMDEIAPDLFECVALESLPSRYTSNSDDPPNSFRTRDLFRRHPDPKKNHLWKYVSRLDDRITLMNGEKVLPVPMESTIRANSLVNEAVIFGIGKTVPGILIFQSENGSRLSNEEYIDSIWPTIEAANAVAETFSHIPKDLVVVIPPGIDWPHTAKGTFIRAQVYEVFAPQIAEAYDRFENGQGAQLQLELPEIETFLLEKFHAELYVDIASVDTDLFAAGVDSLQTTRIWSIIKKQLDLGGKQSMLSQNVLFEKRTIRNVARYLYDLRVGGSTEMQPSAVEQMRELIDRYSTFAKRGTHVLLITGATGALGSFLVADAVRRPSVSTVWALVRASDSTEAASRVHHSLSSRGLTLSKYEMSKIIARPSDFSQATLGLTVEDRHQIRSSLTHVIHAAWAVNFNLGVQSFEEQHIRGLYNLINTCLEVNLATPAELYFCSSISVAGGTPKPATIAERVIDQLHHAQNMGYAQSKMVGEHIVRNAMQSTGMYARVVRIGQIVGDTGSAVWNETEAIPLMIRSAITTGALPALDEVHSWLPADYCARAIVDIALRHVAQKACLPEDTDPSLIYHIRNPRVFHWTKELLPALRTTHLPAFETVEVSEWLQRLRESDPDPRRNPSVKLIDYWERKYRNGTYSKPINGTPPTNGAHLPNGTGFHHGKTPSQGGDTINSAPAEDEDPGACFTIEMNRAIAATSALAQPPDLLQDNHIHRFVAVWLRLWGVSEQNGV